MIIIFNFIDNVNDNMIKFNRINKNFILKSTKYS
jgi:hypothetical protein